MNILFTCAGRRNYLLRYFREELQDRGKIYAVDMSGTAPALQEADQCFTVPALTDVNYIPELVEICKKEKINLIISLNDVELPLLARHSAEFNAVGTNLLISSVEVIDTCFDKLKTKDFLRNNNFRYPETFIDLNSAEDAVRNADVQFPLFVKPRWGSASMQIFSVHSIEELKLAYELAGIQLQKSFLKVDASLLSESILIQDGLPGTEYGIDILNDLEGNVRSVYVKRKLGMRAGETDKSELVDIPLLQELGERIGKAVGHIGNLDCDVFYDGASAVVLEMNPRFGGGYPFSHTLGANFPLAIIEWCSGDEFDLTDFTRNFGKTVSKCDTLVVVSS